MVSPSLETILSQLQLWALMLSFRTDFERELQNDLDYFFFSRIATIPDFRYCSWHSKSLWQHHRWDWYQVALQAVLSFWPTSFGTCAGTLTFVAFIHQDKPPCPSLTELPRNREASSFFVKKKKGAFFFSFSSFQDSLSNCSVQLCSAQVSPVNPTAGERSVEAATHTSTHVCTQNTGRAAQRGRRRCISLWLTATRVQWQG